MSVVAFLALLSKSNRLGPSPQAAHMHHSSSASSLSGGGFSRTPSSDSLFFQFDDLFAQQSARNVELESMSACSGGGDRRRRRPSLARRLSRLFGPQQQEQLQQQQQQKLQDKSLILPGIHKSQSQPQFRPHPRRGLEGYSLPRPLHSCSSASQRSSCSSEELSDASSSKNGSSDSSNSFADVFGRFDPSRVPLHFPLAEEDGGPIFNKSDQQRASRTLPRSLLQKQISRKKILDSLFEEPDRPGRLRMAREDPVGGPPSDPEPEPVSAVITPVHRRVRKPGMVMSLSRCQLVRNLLSAESNHPGCDDDDDAMLKNGGCDDYDDNDAFVGGGCDDEREDNVGDLCDDVIDDEDMKDIFDSADGDQVVPEVKGAEGCEKEEGEGDIERTRRKIEKKVLVIFDGDQLPTNKGVWVCEGREGSRNFTREVASSASFRPL